MQSVLADANVDEFVAGIRALGLINKFITVPLWRVIEDNSITILDMNNIYTSMRDLLKLWSQDATPLLSGEANLFGARRIRRDEVFLQLIEDSKNNDLTIEVLQVLLKGFYLTMERMLVDHLPGGSHDTPSEAQQFQTKSDQVSTKV